MQLLKTKNLSIMKCSVKVNDKVEGFDLTLKLNNLSAIQMSSFYQSFDYYIKHLKKHKEIFNQAATELPESILKGYDIALREAVEISSKKPYKTDKKAA
jgi:hypothetical protein